MTPGQRYIRAMRHVGYTRARYSFSLEVVERAGDSVTPVQHRVLAGNRRRYQKALSVAESLDPDREASE